MKRFALLLWLLGCTFVLVLFVIKVVHVGYQEFQDQKMACVKYGMTLEVGPTDHCIDKDGIVHRMPNK